MEIKESMELLEGLKLLAIESKKLMADGKVNLGDLPVLLDLVQNVGVLAAAVQGADQVGAELKELSSEELQKLGEKVLEIVAAVKAA